jgi:hypothetical protein
MQGAFDFQRLVIICKEQGATEGTLYDEVSG